MDIQSLIRQVKMGEQEAFRQLVTAFQQYAFSLAFRITCDTQEAEDVVQESFIKIWRKIGSYDKDHNFTSWLLKIVTHTAIDHYRKRKRQQTISIEDASNSLYALTDKSTSGDIENKEMANLIRLLADDLPEKQRLTFILRDLQEMESSEVQGILALDETQVKSNLYHARKTIRNRLNTLLVNERKKK